MRNRFRTLTIAVVSAAAMAFLSLAVTESAGQAPAAQAPRPAATGQAPASPLPRAAGKPDFSGIWHASNTANWDLQTHVARPMVAQRGATPNIPVLAAPVLVLGSMGWVPPGIGVVEGEDIPYQPWAATRKKENQEHWLDRDPELKCFMPGGPRAMYLLYTFQ